MFNFVVFVFEIVGFRKIYFFGCMTKVIFICEESIGVLLLVVFVVGVRWCRWFEGFIYILIWFFCGL